MNGWIPGGVHLLVVLLDVYWGGLAPLVVEFVEENVEITVGCADE